ncbi:Sfum_1244 family protein [Desulfospira joergensenii]|uniref:Sfum_1244 family protein n=1 Tax=Desulfospira joergensenii TaxID=53329 RepID=UPI0012947BDE|nr:Sfum_1244 family protein [Desulfospira joergensenii]
MIENKKLGEFIETIQDNCDISDAAGSGIFSICGMALRLRDLSKWEKGLKPWEENDPEELLNWIDLKEQLWEKTEELDFKPLPLLGREYDPFDTHSINQALSPFHLFYGAGYAHSLKPTFFLAGIEKIYDLDGTPVILLGRELVRDLLTIPALNQDGAILIRRDAAGLFLWDQMVYLKKSGQRFLRLGLRHCGLPDFGIESRKLHFQSILSVQEQTYIHHEIGEIRDRVFDHQVFREIVSEFPRTPVELLARTVKDLLADTGPQGTLKDIIATKNITRLGLYAAFQDGLFRPLFPRLRPAVERFASDRDWEGIEEARQEGFQTARQYAGDLTAMFCENPGRENLPLVETQIKERLLQPLGV